MKNPVLRHELQRATRAYGLRLASWHRAVASGRYVVVSVAVPCSRTPGCWHVVAGLLSRN